MENSVPFLSTFSQHENLPIRIVTPGFGHLAKEEMAGYGTGQRFADYFFLFMVDGEATYEVDLGQVDVKNNELLFVLPGQVQRPPETKNDSLYFKIGFDETCLSLLPRQYPFLVNPLNTQKIVFTAFAAARINSVFEILLELLSTMDTDQQLILAHLNSLLTEIDTGYFASEPNPADANLIKYIGFRNFVENHLTDHPTIKRIAGELSLNSNSLYNIVKHYSGLSPKEFITNRLILEARRRIYYSETSSVKELAFDLGFNDPEYFSRLFKKITGKSVSIFSRDAAGK